ncbi:DUF6153 family protein [Streptomyces sp. CA-250714]|uniref:DUF6153 family protein n=1 Tax=Streptomyces sp. CA-250714 TaxID=3240060 RepID=UPI003D8DA6DF
MTSPRHTRPPCRASAGWLLVLVVLTGLLAMHGLGPVPTLGGAHHGGASTGHGQAGVAHQQERNATAHGADGGCHQPAYDHGHGDGHLGHADATCAASGVSGSPPPADLTANENADVTRGTPVTGSGPATATQRAPPSLAQLQLLRI